MPSTSCWRLILIVGGVVGAQFGVRAGAKLRGEQLRLLLALLVLAVALRLLWGLVVHAGRSLQPDAGRHEAALLLLAACSAVPRRRAAEDLVSGLSQDMIQITSNYTGSDIVVFGAIERPAERRQGRDIVVVVRGPDSRHDGAPARPGGRASGSTTTPPSLNGMPAYYYLASTRPLAAHRAAATRWRVTASGCRTCSPTRVHSHHDHEPFRQAAMRHHGAGRALCRERRAASNSSARRCSAPMCRCPRA